MHLLKKLVILLLSIGFFSPAFAAVDSYEPTFCSVYSEAEEDDKKKTEGGDKETEEEEEPDCE